MTPQQFIAKWQRANLTERSACQQHFLDLCDLLGQPKPAEADPDGERYTFERGAQKTGGGDGWADVWMRGHFGWEYKGKRKDLAAAYRQLLLYREDLENPPLLVVCDMDRFEIHTNFTGTVKRVYSFDLAALANPANLDVLRKLFTDPEALRPDQTPVGITEAASALFGQLADGLRLRGVPAADAAHFVMKLVFCLFAEDIGLLPNRLFTTLAGKCKDDPKRLARLLKDLFEAMSAGGDFGADTIDYFNGGLFADAAVIELRQDEIERVIELSRYDWSQVEPSIFGTLFERTLDPDKRAQIGAHFTSKEDILTLVEPVLMAPLRREWTAVKATCDDLWARIQMGSGLRGPGSGNGAGQPGTRNPRPGTRPSAARRKHDKVIQDFVEHLAHVRVLDPACGSGNFLYVAIQLLLDLEKEVIAYAADHQLGLLPHVRPTQLHGIEINPYAQQLAQVVIWIGYLQWMHHNGFSPPRNPVLEPIESIRLMDAIVDLSEPERPKEPDWPEADVIIGNPPFLGGKMLRANLGDEYVDAMFKLWDKRVARESDLCCYWFEKARAAINLGRIRRAGLLATQGIRGGANRETLKRIKETGDIFFAISDRDWILDGANVHVSMVGFDDGSEKLRTLDGGAVAQVNPELTASAALSHASRLAANRTIAFMGATPAGKFEIRLTQAREWIALPNASGRSNEDVLRPWLNGADIMHRSRGVWIVDFGCDVDMNVAAQYEAPFEYVRRVVAPNRQAYRTGKRGYWCFERPRPDMRAAIEGLRRYVATPTLAKFRVFVWVPHPTLPDHQLIVFARDDDYFFGVLHSAIHERWSLRMGTALEDRPRYTPTTCFETFPFPAGSGGIAKDCGAGILPAAGAPSAGTSRRTPSPLEGELSPSPRPSPLEGEGDCRLEACTTLRGRIAVAAKKLDEFRENWLNPRNADGSPAMTETQLKKRTLTNLYNDRPTWLELAHLELDRSVLAGYGWPEEWAEKLQPQRDKSGKVNPILGVADPATEQEVLARLLALNLASRPLKAGGLPEPEPAKGKGRRTKGG